MGFIVFPLLTVHRLFPFLQVLAQWVLSTVPQEEICFWCRFSDFANFHFTKSMLTSYGLEQAVLPSGLRHTKDWSLVDVFWNSAGWLSYLFTVQTSS
jgi:hypothetical protein